MAHFPNDAFSSVTSGSKTGACPRAGWLCLLLRSASGLSSTSKHSKVGPGRYEFFVCRRLEARPPSQNTMEPASPIKSLRSP